MLCTLCIHGVNVNRLWTCACGERHCRHIDVCPKCGVTKKAMEEKQDPKENK